MNKKVCIILLALFSVCFFHLQAATPLWTWEKELTLEKEQEYKAHFQVGEVQKELLFRWTLYKNEGLVMHIRYDKFNHQVILYTDYQRNAYRLALGRGESNKKDLPWLFIYFKDFQEKKAYFKLYTEGKGAILLDENL